MSVYEKVPGGADHLTALRRAAELSAETAANRLASANRLAAGSVGSQRFTRYVGIIVGLFGVVYSLQSIRQFLTDLPSFGGGFAVPTIVLIWGSVLSGPIAALKIEHARPIRIVGAGAYALGVALLPFAIVHPILPTHIPWVVAISAAPLIYLALGSTSTAFAITVDVVIAVDIAVTLMTAGRMRPPVAIVDSLLVVMVSVVLTLMVAALRAGVQRATRAQQTLLTNYAANQAEEATEAERRRTDALLHDVVLTTFLAAASAQTPETEELAGRMAANAVRIFSHVTRSTEYGDVIPFAEAWAEVQARLVPLVSRFAIVDGGSGSVILPAVIADAMLDAMAEAMTNSVQHADAENRELRITPLGPDGLRIVVHDDGIGFDLASVQLSGLSTVVQQPLNRFFGRADIDTAPGQGCTVVLSWGSIVMSGTGPVQDDSLVTA